MIHWSVQPLIPTSLWLALVILAVVLMLVYAMRKPAVVTRLRWVAIVTLMSTAIALVLALLLNPIRIEDIPPPAGKPLLTVLVDATASMNTPDAGGATRYQAAVKAANDLADHLAERFDVRVRTFTDTATIAEVKDLKVRRATGQRTDLAAAITSCLDDERPQGQAIALLSDGIHNSADSVQDASRLARAMASPVYTHTFGGDTGGFDLGIAPRSAQDMAFVGQKVLVTAVISHSGLTGTHPNVMLLRDGKEIARERADLPEGRPGEVHFWVSQDKTGMFPYEMRVESLPGELTLANNAASYLLRVVDEPVRVLQVEGKPYWDSKFLMRTLAGAPAVELDSAVRISDDRVMWRTIRRGGEESTTQPVTAPPATAPSPGLRVETWKIVNNAGGLLADAKFLGRYQIVVLGRDAEPFLTDAAIANLQNWLSRSGGVWSATAARPPPRPTNGSHAFFLSDGRGAPESRFHVKMTDKGRDMHWLGDAGGSIVEGDTLPRLPTLASTAQPQSAKVTAITLASSVSPTGEGTPAVIYQRYGGDGRVVVIEGAGMWRWAFLPPQFQKQEEVYHALWHSMMRWLVSQSGLMPGQKMMLRSDNLSFATGEPAGLSMLVREEAIKGQPPVVELTPAAGWAARAFAPVAVPETPGSYHIDFGKLPEGRYEAKIVGAAKEDSFSRVIFDVRPFGNEELDINARPALMKQIADDSGGAVLGDDILRELSRRFSEHLARIRPPRSQRTTAWDRWWILAAVIATWGASWWLRRSGGLV